MHLMKEQTRKQTSKTKVLQINLVLPPWGVTECIHVSAWISGSGLFLCILAEAFGC